MSAEPSDDDSIVEEELEALFNGREDGDDDEVVPIHQPTYKELFGSMTIRNAVQEVVYRAACLMGRLRGDNKADDAEMSTGEGRELARDAYEFVAKFMIALFGPMNTSKAYRLAYHLFDELLLRRNLMNADTSIHEMLQKLIKIMYRRTNKHDQAFTLQLRRAEQTLAYAIDEDADREMVRKSGLLGPEGALLDPSGKGQAVTERALVDGGTTAAALRLRRGRAADEAEYADDEGTFDLPVGRENVRRLARRRAARRAATAARTLRRMKGTVPLRAAVGAGTVGGPDVAASNAALALRWSDQALADAARHGHNEGARDAPRGRRDRAIRGGGQGGAVAASAEEDAAECLPAGPAVRRSSDVATHVAERPDGQADATGTGLLTRSVGPRFRGGHLTQGSPEAASSRPHPTRVQGVNVTAADVVAKGCSHLESLRSLVHLSRSAKLKVTNQLSFESTFEWRSARRKQHVHAADMCYKSAWFDHVMCRVTGSKKAHIGRAVLLVKTIDGASRDLIIVQMIMPADERPACVLSWFKCQRLRWSMSRRAAHPRLTAVHVSDLLRLVHVVPDFKDLSDRHGIHMAPTHSPQTQGERVLERFFVNRFYPWTSNGLGRQ